MYSPDPDGYVKLNSVLPSLLYNHPRSNTAGSTSNPFLDLYNNGENPWPTALRYKMHAVHQEHVHSPSGKNPRESGSATMTLPSGRDYTILNTPRCPMSSCLGTPIPKENTHRVSRPVCRCCVPLKRKRNLRCVPSLPRKTLRFKYKSSLGLLRGS